MIAAHVRGPLTTTWLLGASGVALGGGMMFGSLILVIAAGILGWLAVAMSFPRGGLAAPIAIGLLWSNAAVVSSERIGAPTSLGILPQLLLAAVVIGRLLVHQRPLIFTTTFRALLVHGAALMVAGLAAIDAVPVQSVVVTFAVEGVLLWLLVINSIDERQVLERALLALVLACGVLGALAVVQFLTGTYSTNYFGFAQVGESRLELLESGKSSLPRLAGPLGEQNRWAQSLLVVIPMGIGLARSNRRVETLVLVSLVPIVAGVALTGSRGAVVGFAATLVAMAAMRLISRRAIGMIVLVAAVTVMVVPGYSDRIVDTILSAEPSAGADEVDQSTLSRVATNLAAFHMFEDHVLLGVGPDGFPRMYESYAERVGLNVKDQARQPHNLYLGVAAEMGIIGLITFMVMPVMLLVSLTRSWRSLRLRDPPIASLVAGLVGAIVAYLSSGIFLHLAFDRYYWLLLAICDVGARIARRSVGSDATSGRTADVMAESAT